jgi:outer membrane protein assembly factor BamB
MPDGISDNLDGIYGTPVLSSDGRVVFLGDYNGYVYAFRPGDFTPGVTVTQPFASGVKLSDPIIGGLTLNSSAGQLYVASGKRIYLISAVEMIDRIATRGEDPKRAVLFEAEDEIWGRPVLADGKLLFTSLDGRLYAVDPDDGALIWSFRAGEGLVSTPLVVGNSVLVSGFGSTMFSVDLADGSQEWSYSAGHWIWGEPAIVQNTAYVGDFDGILHAIDTSNGGRRWSLELDKGPIRASPVLAAGTLIVATDDGWLMGIDPASQEIAWQRDLGTALNAGMTVQGTSVYIAPRSCVTPEGGGDRVYYIQVNPSNGDLTRASGVC